MHAFARLFDSIHVSKHDVGAFLGSVVGLQIPVGCRRKRSTLGTFLAAGF
jgi:uncharacterized protein YcfJ